jgi:phosphatidylinositol-3-phosphatase
MISGQAATAETRNDCQTYQDFNLTGITADGQAVGSGCVYPASIKTLPDQLDAAGKTWRGYMGDMGNDPSRESAACGHPTLNAIDHTNPPKPPPPRFPWAISTPLVTIRSSISTPSSILPIATNASSS